MGQGVGMVGRLKSFVLASSGLNPFEAIESVRPGGDFPDKPDEVLAKPQWLRCTSWCAFWIGFGTKPLLVERFQLPLKPSTL